MTTPPREAVMKQLHYAFNNHAHLGRDVVNMSLVNQKDG
jgi:hypothetical protein